MKKKITVANTSSEYYLHDALIVKTINLCLNKLNLSRATIEVLIVDNDESALFNIQYRNKFGPTNVLSFDTYENGQLILCAPIINKEHYEYDFELNKYWAFIIIHGTLHLCGYTHDKTQDTANMEHMEKEILADLKL